MQALRSSYYNSPNRQQRIENNNFFNEQLSDSVAFLRSQSPILKKVSNFIEMKEISISEFWKSTRNYASASDILSFCSSSGFRMSVQNEINLKLQLFANREVISIYEFAEKIEVWKTQGQAMVIEFLKNRSGQLVEQIQARKETKLRAQSSHNTLIRGKSAKSAPSVKITLPKRGLSATRLKKQTFLGNNSKAYLQKHRQKQQRLEKSLAETIDKTNNEFEYSMLLKMTQANEISKDMESPITFRAYKNAEGTIKVRVFNYNKIEKEINLIEFQREYKSLKKKNNETKQWDRLGSNSGNLNTGKVLTNRYLNDIQSENMPSYELKNAKKAERQQQLKSLLVNTVNLTNLLREQIKIFRMKGIYGCE